MGGSWGVDNTGRWMEEGKKWQISSGRYKKKWFKDPDTIDAKHNNFTLVFKIHLEWMIFWLGLIFPFTKKLNVFRMRC